MNPYQTYIAKSRYSKYLAGENRREDYDETVDRWLNFFKDKVEDDSVFEGLRTSMLSMDTMPSMRCFMTAGEALRKSNVAGYNCSYLPVDHPRAFDELMYILMNGTGVGFSVERQYVDKLPEIADEFFDTDTVIHIADSKIGWAKAFKELISLLYSGQVPSWDSSRVRPKGSALKTFGGRASGPEPLEALFRFTVETFKGAAGRKLNGLEAHDICCKVADIVVVGGVRRSALISLSNLTDTRIAKCKHGEYRAEHGHRDLANNSVVYTQKPDLESFMTEWVNLYESKRGERGFFSRVASQNQAAKNGRRDPDHEFGTNPCSEIILRPNQFCNLSEVVIRPSDTFETLKTKVANATIMGTLQSTLTDFKYLRPIWKRNTEEEALLGVSMTGIQDHPFMAGKVDSHRGFEGSLPEVLEALKAIAVETNKKWAKALGINQSTAITCVKPSGTVSQLVDSASGIHGRFARFYRRRVRADATDPLCQVLKDAGVPWEEADGNPNALVFSFPDKAPEGSVIASEQTGIEQLELWSLYQEHWCEHKPSITVYYNDDNFLDIGAWLFKNFDKVSGVAFMPHTEHAFVQAPYEEITEEEHQELVASMPKEINWDIAEHDDNTEGAQTLACVGNVCEV